MELLTIGEFARASRLSAKALRLYDDLGLLPPARVDPVTGYRLYAPEQLERARLVLWLRRLGMPLADIRVVCDLPPTVAAGRVAAFWDRVEAQTASRRELAAHLVRELADPPDVSQPSPRPGDRWAGRSPGAEPGLRIRYAVRSEPGLVRPQNQDAVHAGPRLLAVADGFGSQGAPASAAAIASVLAASADATLTAGELLNALADAAGEADRVIGGLVGGDDGGPAGTTLTALAVSGSHLALVHIGDSRAYLLRDGGLFLITHDHTVVRALVDEGRLTEAEAASHPQRALLLRALDGRAGTAPELRLLRARPGDRYLVCSDGLSAVLPDGELRRVLSGEPDAEAAVRQLLDLVHAAGAPDNVSCVVADVDEAVDVGELAGVEDLRRGGGAR